MTEQTKGVDGADRLAGNGASADPARIEQLKQAIARGDYSVDEKAIAEKIIAQGALDDLN